MKTNQAGLDLIKSFEGLHLEPYICPAGVPTIGYGSTFYEDGSKVTMKDSPITKERAEELLEHTLSGFEAKVSHLVKVPISDSQFSALVSFAYNVGTQALANSTLLKLLNSKHPKHVVAEQFLRWNKVRKNGILVEEKGLTRRRQAEKALFLS